MEQKLKYIIIVLPFSIISHFQSFCHVLSAMFSFFIALRWVVYGISTNRHVNRFRICVSQMTMGHLPVDVVIIRSFPHSWRITMFETKIILQVPHLEQELLALHEHHSSSDFLWGSCCSIFSFQCSALYITGCPIVFFLLAIVFCFLQFIASDYPFGIFRLLFSWRKVKCYR
jgi:hypothetical protein